MANQLSTDNMTDTGNLENLPIEIRKQIYTHLLVEPKTIAIKRYINPKSYMKGEVARMSHHRKANRDREIYDRRRKTWVEAPPESTSILLVNKAVSQEATPVFYGSNDFFFDNTGALQDFLAWIGQSRQYLRHVEIDGNHGSGIKFNASWTAMDHSMSLLKSAKGLRALHFYHTGLCGHERDRTEIDDLAVHCSPLLEALQATCEARNVYVDILDVVKIVLPPCHCKLCPEPEKRCHYFVCRDLSTHEFSRSRFIVMPGGGQYEKSSRQCAGDCEAADDVNKSFNEKLKDGIMRQLGLPSSDEEA